MTNDRDKLLRYLINLCEDLSKGHYKKAKELFELTKEGKYPSLIAELAETFGMMMVKLEAREYRLEQVIDALKKAKAELSIAKKRLSEENIHLKKDLRQKFMPSGFLGANPQIRELIAKAERVADTPANILITGETGTGKELIAKMIHYNSSRREGPLVTLNCSALPETIFESEMFGIEKGVATGVEKRIGKIEQADGGTLFLDEIGDMPMSSQAKILRIIENGELEHVGGRKTISVNIRIIAATNKDLRKESEKGAFRGDLMYRLNVVNLHIPPLRERRDDIPLLANFFLEQSVRRLGREKMRFAPEVIGRFMTYPWPGNVRELENEVERSVILSFTDTVTIDGLSESLMQSDGAVEPGEDSAASLKDNERDLIIRTLRITGGNKTKAATMLGFSREGLRKKMNRYGLK
jgi:transcriptional regulator with GAF, ATPase, and Fis domain